MSETITTNPIISSLNPFPTEPDAGYSVSDINRHRRIILSRWCRFFGVGITGIQNLLFNFVCVIGNDFELSYLDDKDTIQEFSFLQWHDVEPDRAVGRVRLIKKREFSNGTGATLFLSDQQIDDIQIVTIHESVTTFKPTKDIHDNCKDFEKTMEYFALAFVPQNSSTVNFRTLDFHVRKTDLPQFFVPFKKFCSQTAIMIHTRDKEILNLDHQLNPYTQIALFIKAIPPKDLKDLWKYGSSSYDCEKENGFRLILTLLSVLVLSLRSALGVSSVADLHKLKASLRKSAIHIYQKYGELKESEFCNGEFPRMIISYETYRRNHFGL